MGKIVYVVWIKDCWGGCLIHGIYSDKKLAEKSFGTDKWRRSSNTFSISKYKLDLVDADKGKL
jgi:hypothetical protein